MTWLNLFLTATAANTAVGIAFMREMVYNTKIIIVREGETDCFVWLK